MAEVLERIEQPPLVLHPSPGMQMDDEQFFQFCQANRDLRIERTAEGDLIIMPPAGGSSSQVLKGFVLDVRPVWAAMARRK